MISRGTIVSTTKRIKYFFAKVDTTNIIESRMKELHPEGYIVVDVGHLYIIVDVTT